MGDVMVTGRMPEEKKSRATRILHREGFSSSQAINLLFDRIIDQGNADFLRQKPEAPDDLRWKQAADFVDALSEKRTTRFDDMSKADIRVDRLRARGLM